MSTPTRPADTYSPLYFLASVGAGGLAVTFFMFLMFWVPHPGQPVPIFEDIAAAWGTGNLPLQIAIARAYGHLGFPSKARDILDDAYQAALVVWGETHEETLSVLSGLVSACAEAHDFARAKALGERCLALCETHLPEHHPVQLDAKLSLGRLLVFGPERGKHIYDAIEIAESGPRDN